MTSPVPILLERDNVNDESVTLIRWFAADADQVTANSLLAEVETSKANIEVYAPAAGFLVYSFAEGAEVPVGSPIGHIASEPPALTARTADIPEAVTLPTVQRPPLTSPSLSRTEADAPPSTLQFKTVTGFKQRFSPVAQKMMELHGLTSADFSGQSVVRKQDVLDLLQGPSVVPAQPALRPSSEQPYPPAVKPISQPYKEVALSKMKRREGSALATGTRNAVSSAVSVLCYTRGLRQILEKRVSGGNASAAVVYEVSRLLRKYPALNATYREGAMLLYEKVNVGFAMDDGRGLKVGVLHDCDTLSLQQVALQLRNLTLAYLDDKLTPVQIANATFTISDLSGMGVSSFFPLISEDQGGILGVGAEQFAPGSEYGSFTLTLTFDHQLTDGRGAALFLNDLKERLSNYEKSTEDRQDYLACSQCGRPEPELVDKRQNLLRSVVPQGYLCTLCVAGY